MIAESPTSKPRERKGVRAILKSIALFLTVFISGVACAGAVYWNDSGSFAPLLISVASHVVPLMGDHVPIIHSPYGDVRISSRQTAEGLAVEVGCSPCRMASPKIGPAPFTIPSARISGTMNKGQFRGFVEAEELRVQLEGLWDGKSFRGAFNLPDTSIKRLYHVVRSIVPEADSASIEGSVSGRGSFLWPQGFLRWKPKIKGFRVSGLVNLPAYTQGNFRFLAIDKDDKPLQLEAGEGTADWIPFDAIGKYLPAAIIAAEDGAFYSHPGYDVASMDEALKENEQIKKIRRGGSTITQQLAKNLFLTAERSYTRKLRELLYAVNLEQLGKRRILEIYLNIIEWGPDIHGIKSAGQVYFRKLPRDLLPEEAAWLAGIARYPKRSWRREYLTGSPQFSRVLTVLGRMTGLTDEEKQQAISRRISFARNRTEHS